MLHRLTTDQDAFDTRSSFTPARGFLGAAGGGGDGGRRDRSISLPCPPPDLASLLGGPATPPATPPASGGPRKRGFGLAHAGGSCKDLAALAGED